MEYIGAAYLCYLCLWFHIIFRTLIIKKKRIQQSWKCAPYVIISGKCPAVILARMGMMLRWRHFTTSLSQRFQFIYINVNETVNFREEAVRYHNQTGGKFSRFESGVAHFRWSTLLTQILNNFLPEQLIISSKQLIILSIENL
jgi:hypothetical protein